MKVCQVCATAEELRTSKQNVESRQRLLDLMQEAEEVDKELQNWNQGPIPWWVYQDIGDIQGLETSTPGHTNSASQAVHIYQDSWIACLWNFYRTGRIALHSMLLECADFLDISEWSGHEAREGSPSSKYAKSICVIDGMICASIPFVMGDVNKEGKLMDSNRKAIAGFHLMWPLYVAKNCPYALPEQVAAVQSTLRRIGYGMGIRQALVMPSYH